MTKKILVIGELNIDLILNDIKGFPSIGTEKIASEFDLTLGSSSAIFASNLASLGTDVSYLGMVGDDNFGTFILQELKSKNVATENILKSLSSKTGVTVVMNYAEDRAMVTYPGAMSELSMEHISKQELSSFDHVHISSVFLQPKIEKDLVPIFKLLKENGLTTSLDPQWDPNEKWQIDLMELLKYVDVFLPNKVEFLAISKCSTIHEGFNKYNEFSDRIVVKNGSEGAHILEENKIITQEAFFNPNVIDCIGAGDSFDAGYIHQFVKGKARKKCLEFANITGAINTTAPGGTSAFKSFDEIRKIAIEKFNYTI